MVLYHKHLVQWLPLANASGLEARIPKTRPCYELYRLPLAPPSVPSLIAPAAGIFRHFWAKLGAKPNPVWAADPLASRPQRIVCR
jgi:hypothetical protein